MDCHAFRSPVAVDQPKAKPSSDDALATWSAHQAAGCHACDDAPEDKEQFIHGFESAAARLSELIEQRDYYFAEFSKSDSDYVALTAELKDALSRVQAPSVTDAMVVTALDALMAFGDPGLDPEVPYHFQIVGDDPNGAMKAALEAALGVTHG